MLSPLVIATAAWVREACKRTGSQPATRGGRAFSKRPLMDRERQAIMNPSGVGRVGSDQTDIAS